MDTYSGSTIKVIKQVTKVVFDDLDTRKKVFAKKYVDCYDSKTAHDYAFDDVNQVRASTFLQDPELWEVIFKEMKLKKVLSKRETLLLSSYENIKENFDLSPFEIFRVYVEKAKKNDMTLACSLNIDCCQSFQTLLYAYSFFKLLNREYFYKGTKEVLLKEAEMIDLSGRNHEKNIILKKAKSCGVDYEDFFEK